MSRKQEKKSIIKLSVQRSFLAPSAAKYINGPIYTWAVDVQIETGYWIHSQKRASSRLWARSQRDGLNGKEVLEEAS